MRSKKSKTIKKSNYKEGMKNKRGTIIEGNTDATTDATTAESKYCPHEKKENTWGINECNEYPDCTFYFKGGSDQEGECLKSGQNWIQDNLVNKKSEDECRDFSYPIDQSAAKTMLTAGARTGTRRDIDSYQRLANNVNGNWVDISNPDDVNETTGIIETTCDWQGENYWGIAGVQTGDKITRSEGWYDGKGGRGKVDYLDNKMDDRKSGAAGENFCENLELNYPDFSNAGGVIFCNETPGCIYDDNLDKCVDDLPYGLVSEDKGGKRKKLVAHQDIGMPTRTEDGPEIWMSNASFHQFAQYKSSNPLLFDNVMTISEMISDFQGSDSNDKTPSKKKGCDGLTNYECSVKNLSLDPNMVLKESDLYNEDKTEKKKFKIATSIAKKYDTDLSISDYIGKEMNDAGMPHQNAHFLNALKAPNSTYDDQTQFQKVIYKVGV